MVEDKNIGGRKMGQKKLVGRLVTLKPLSKIYFGEYLKMFSEKVRELLHVSSGESELEYLEERLERQKTGEIFFYLIFENKENKLVGAIEIRDLQETDSQLYSWVHEDYWGTGVYQEALALVSKEYFDETKEKFYSANVDVVNVRSYHALKKYGFIDSGFKKGPFGKQYVLILRKKYE